jgi:hypothetical protein
MNQPNNCDGCQRNLELKDGDHYDNGHIVMGCTKKLYQEEKKCRFCGKKGCPESAPWECSSVPTPPEEIKIVPSGRIDWCCECKANHGYDCPKDWKEKEREAFEGNFIKDIDTMLTQCNEQGRHIKNIMAEEASTK